MNTPFPQIQDYDPILIESSEFLAETVRDVRLKLKDRMAPKKGKKVVPEIPTHCTIYVAKEYPAWQAACLNILQEGLKKNGKLSENKGMVFISFHSIKDRRYDRIEIHLKSTYGS